MQVAVRVEVHYCTPPNTVLGDVLQLLRSRTWVAFMTQHVGPRLEKISPVDSDVLQQFDTQWQEPAAKCSSSDCAICLDGDDDTLTNFGVKIPCGHVFHRRCIHSWLQLQSTCPICRWQFPKEFAGTFVVQHLQSTIVLPQHVTSWPRASIADAPVGGHSVRVVVSITLEKLFGNAPLRHKPCWSKLTAFILDESSGELWSGLSTSAVADKFSDGVSSSLACRETGRKRNYFHQHSKTSKRQRGSN